MALSKMYRFSAVTLKADAVSFCAGLQRLRCVDIVTSPTGEHSEFVQNKNPEETSYLAAELAKATAAEAFLAGYVT